MITIFIYFFYVPIKYVLSNAPDQVLVVYHSAVLLVGAFITYKAVFYSNKDESSQKGKQSTNCAAKAKEIAAVERQIIHLELMGGGYDIKNRNKINFLWKKISHLRVEIQLQSLHNRFISTLDCQINLDETLRENICISNSTNF